VHETRRKQKGGRVVLKAGMLAASVAAGFAFATPARAAGEHSPPLLLLESSATIVSGDGDAADVAAAPVVVAAATPTEESSDVITPLEAETPANQDASAYLQRVWTRVVATHPRQSAVISVARAASRPAWHRDGANPVRRAGRAWYQGQTRQYREGQPAHVGRARKPAFSNDVGGAVHVSGATRITCSLPTEKCTRFCPVDAGYNLPWNAPSIAKCISQQIAEKIREILAAGPLLVETRALGASWESQYQCDAARYHVDGCVDGASASAADAGWVLFRPSAPLRQRSATAPVEAVASPQRALSASSVVAPRTLGAQATEARRRQPSAPRPASARAGVAAPLASTTQREEGDWLLRTLALLIGVATTALFLAVLSEREGVSRKVFDVRSRLGSKGLSASRIPVGGADRSRPGIRYRE
jgi:hypothetical protein